MSASRARTPTELMNEWLIADVLRLHAWRRVAEYCVRAAQQMHADGDAGRVAAWLLATHLQVRYESAPGEAGLLAVADIDWPWIASALLTGLTP